MNLTKFCKEILVVPEVILIEWLFQGIYKDSCITWHQ